MRIVIEISEEDYERLKHYEKAPFCSLTSRTYEAVANGTPLPEHHGRLIDADRLTRAEIMHLWYHLPNGDIACPKVDIDHAPTIIEADKCTYKETGCGSCKKQLDCPIESEGGDSE